MKSSAALQQSIMDVSIVDNVMIVDDFAFV